jgi:hypothetical protein
MRRKEITPHSAEGAASVVVPPIAGRVAPEALVVVAPVI